MVDANNMILESNFHRSTSLENIRDSIETRNFINSLIWDGVRFVFQNVIF
jgi:hypothetical protein